MDHNPITWPSDDIMGRVPSLDTNEALELWVVDLKEWLADNSSNGPIQPTELTGENHLMLETNGGFQRRPQADIELTRYSNSRSMTSKVFLTS